MGAWSYRQISQSARKVMPSALYLGMGPSGPPPLPRVWPPIRRTLARRHRRRTRAAALAGACTVSMQCAQRVYLCMRCVCNAYGIYIVRACPLAQRQHGAAPPPSAPSRAVPARTAPPLAAALPLPRSIEIDRSIDRLRCECTHAVCVCARCLEQRRDRFELGASLRRLAHLAQGLTLCTSRALLCTARAHTAAYLPRLPHTCAPKSHARALKAV